MSAHRLATFFTAHLIIAGFVVSQLLIDISPLHAQDAATAVGAWSEPVNISQSIGDSSDPTLVADITGTVHLFWSERFGDEVDRRGQRLHGNTLSYRQWRDGEWSPPNDVLVSPDGGEIWQPVAAVDQFGTLHIIWASVPGGRLYYSNAPVAQASNAHAWLAPLHLYTGLPTTALPAGLAVDSRGIIHVIATARDLGQEVVHMASADGGFSWSVPSSLSAQMPGLPGDSLVSGGVALHVDAQDRLHAGWSMFNPEGFGEIVYYAQSSDGGATWSLPFIVGQKAETDYEADWLNIATVGIDRIHLVWTGIGRPPGRLYRTSFDGGTTWTEPTWFMEGMVGETESPRMVVDSAGGVHLFTPARTVTTDTGIRYAYWTGDTWSAPFKIPGPQPDPGAYPALRLTAAANLGNQIWVAWYDEPKGDIYVVSGESSAPAVASAPFVELAPVADDGAQGSGQFVELPTPTPVATPRPTRVIFDAASAPSAQPINAATGLVMSAVASAGVVGIILLAATRRRR